MKKQDLELLVQAGDVERIVISREFIKTAQDSSAQAGLWELWAYGGEATAKRGNVLKTAKGERRWFRNLDTAYEFARAAGFGGQITVEDRFRPES